MRELALFAGAGGGILGGLLLGWRTVCAVELNAHCRRVLLARQRDGIIEPFPIWDDVRTFDGAPWRGHVDVVAGGFPCQDISAAGLGAGIDGERSGLWRDMARIIGEVRPRFVLVENSPRLIGKGVSRVFGDLAAMGYNARSGALGGNHVGLPQCRERLWVSCELADAMRGKPALGRNVSGSERLRKLDAENVARQAKSEPGMVGVAHGVANRMDRLRAIGNGQIPAVARLAWRTLSGGIK